MSRFRWMMAATLLSGCGNLPTTTEGVAFLEVYPPAVLTLVVGTTAQFSARALDRSGVPVEGVVVRWRTPDASVTVNETSGLVTAVSAGIGRIQAVVGEDEIVSDFVSLTVTPPPGAGSTR